MRSSAVFPRKPPSTAPAGSHPPGFSSHKGLKVSVVPRYRYRPSSLIGPWRASRLKAECDAGAVGQAEYCPAGRDLIWRVEGEIEVASEPGETEGPSATVGDR